MPVTDSVDRSDHLIGVAANDVIIGMFVAEIDCPWSKTPFPLGGFHVRNVGDIQVLQKHCKEVTIDTRRGVEPARIRKTSLTILSSARKAAPHIATLKVRRDTYPLTRTVKQQIDATAAAYSRLVTQYEQLARAVRTGERLDLPSLAASSRTLTESILANPQTLIWLLLTESSPPSRHAYCVRAAIWATILGRQVGLPRDELDVLFQGTLLCDIGMHLLPERLVERRGPFRKKEVLAYRKHVDFSLDLLGQYHNLDERISRIVRCHHERHDGRGFPKGLRGDQIPVLSRFAILAHCFERLLRSNESKRKVAPGKIMARLYKQRELKFPEQLVVEFIHVLGMYPVGSLVELSTGERALVLQQNAKDRLNPKIALLTDAMHRPLDGPRLVDLRAEKDGSEARSVVANVSPAEMDIDLSDYTFRFSGRRVSLGPLAFRF